MARDKWPWIWLGCGHFSSPYQAATSLPMRVFEQALWLFMLCLVSLAYLQQGTRHAEFLAIQEMLQKYPRSYLHSTDLYVTVEPCVMCASALMQYRIRAVYFGCGNERFGGTGSVLSLHSESVISTFADGWVWLSILTCDNSVGIDPPYPVYSGLFHKEAIMLLRRFYTQENEKGIYPYLYPNIRVLFTYFEKRPNPVRKRTENWTQNSKTNSRALLRRTLCRMISIYIPYFKKVL